MDRLTLTCRACPNGCQIEVEYEDGEVWDVSGNGCMKGMIYAQSEINNIDEK